MKAKCVGGVLDGQEIEVQGTHARQPIVSREYQTEYGEWADKHLVAWTMETLDGVPEHPVTPPPPSFPVQVYGWELQDDGSVLARIDPVRSANTAGVEG